MEPEKRGSSGFVVSQQTVPAAVQWQHEIWTKCAQILIQILRN
jgi:hypothetical protein